MNTTQTTSTFTNTNSTTSDDFVRQVNEGNVTEVGGREVTRVFRGDRPGRVWQNGSVSVNVKGRKSGTTGTVWVKPGQTVSFS